MILDIHHLLLTFLPAYFPPELLLEIYAYVAGQLVTPPFDEVHLESVSFKPRSRTTIRFKPIIKGSPFFPAVRQTEEFAHAMSSQIKITSLTNLQIPTIIKPIIITNRKEGGVLTEVSLTGPIIKFTYMDCAFTMRQKRKYAEI